MVDLLYFFSILLEKEYYPILIVLTFLALAFSRHRRILILSMLVIVLLSPTLKTFYMEDRPCKEMPALVDCNDYGFPSGHALTSILLPAATLGSYAFFAFLPLAFTIAFSRIFIGVHTINQVVAGISLGLFVFFVLARLHEHMRHGKTPHETKKLAKIEEGRQIIHILAGFAIIGMLYLFGLNVNGLEAVELLLLGLMISGLMLINMRMLGMYIGPFHHILDNFDRVGEEFPGRGPLLYLVGTLLILSYIKDFNFILAAIAIFSVGDGVSTLIGRRYGKNVLSWNSRKSWEGTLAFFISSAIVSYFFIGLAGIYFSAILAFIETIDFHVDDNLLIPFFSVILYTFI